MTDMRDRCADEQQHAGRRADDTEAVAREESAGHIAPRPPVRAHRHAVQPALDIRVERIHRGISLPRIFRRRARADGTQIRRDAFDAIQQLVEQEAERIDVVRGGRRGAAPTRGARVVMRDADGDRLLRIGAARARVLDDARHTEVEQLCDAVLP